MRRNVLAAICLLEAILGDPAGVPHPVRAIGRAIEAGEALVRARISSGDPPVELAAGSAFALAIAGGAAGCAFAARSVAAGPADLILGAAALAMRSLDKAVGEVQAALEAHDLPLARARLARIVGRDTEDLPASEIARATLETAAESLCDGVIAPLLALRLGGIAGAWAFKAVSTLDSMIGHVEAPYTYFGRGAARLDDLLNYVPARMTVVAIALAALLCGGDAIAALSTAYRDGPLHRSPNAGWCEAALAGALRVRLGGNNRYGGFLTAGAIFGERYRAPQLEDVARCRRVIAVAALLAAIAAIASAPG